MPTGTAHLDRGVGELSPALVRAAERFGTPVYVLDMVSVDAAARQVAAAFGPPWILQYSLKANDLPALVAFLRDRGLGANVVSAGEWRSARAGQVGNAAVSFEGIGKTDADLAFAVTETASGRPPRWLAVESADEAGRLADLAASHRLGRDGRPGLDLLVRLNPEVVPETTAQFAVGARASKFGMTGEEILALAASGLLDSPGLRLRGVHVHAGSDLRDVAAWATAGVRAVRLLGLLRRFSDAADTVDFGGGFPLPSDGAPGPDRFRQALTAALAQAGLALPARPAIEPGRYLVGAAGWLVASVLHARAPRPGPGRDDPQVVLDAGMTELIRPALYGSRHAVHALPAGPRSVRALTATLVEGPVCESTDSLGVHQLPPLGRGDLVALAQAGAYAASFTSRYNGRPQPPEVLLMSDGSLELARRPYPAGSTVPGVPDGRSGFRSPGARPEGLAALPAVIEGGTF